MIPYSKKFQEMMKRASPELAELFDRRMHRNILVRYNARSDGYQDIRKVFKQTKEDDQILIDYYKTKITHLNDWDKLAVELAQLVNRRLTYDYDSNNWGRIEYWASPIEIHKRRIDDCDGYAVLTVYLWGLFGIPAYRRFVRAGNVNSGEGHATAIYMSLYNNLFYPIEGSYYPKETFQIFKEKKFALGQNPRYTKTWWITNENRSYSDKWFFQFI